MEEATEIVDWLDARRVRIAPIDPASIIGIGHALTACRALLGRLTHAEFAAAAGLATPRGVLLHGPAGTGKTLTARWLAGELGDIEAYDLPPEDLEPARVRSAFGHLAMQPRSVVFLPEIDAVGLDRRTGDSDSRRTLFALLEGLDGLRPIAPAAGPLVIATTNRGVGALDAALTRAGRLGLHIGFRTPNEGERLALLQRFAVGRPIAPDIAWERYAGLTDSWTPADLKAGLDDAFGLALLRDGVAARISEDDLLVVIRRGGEIDPDDDAPSVADLDHAAVHEAGHAAVASVLGLAVRSVRLALHGRAGSTEVGPADRAITDEETMRLVVVALAGVAAERIICGSPTHGARDDVKAATALLIRRIEAGVDPDFAPMSRSAWGEWTPRVVDEAMARHIFELLQGARARAAAIVREREASIRALARTIREAHALAGEELIDAIERAGLPAAPETDERETVDDAA
ncbi:MAG: AAA family ATPase [Candidatus Limnocylindrales bacterium]